MTMISWTDVMRIFLTGWFKLYQHFGEAICQYVQIVTHAMLNLKVYLLASHSKLKSNILAGNIDQSL